MKFNWDGFTELEFADYCEKAKNKELYPDTYIGCVRVGDLCFDLRVVKPDLELVLDYDLYIGGVDDGYGYGKDGYPYTDGDGGSLFELCTDYKYNEFVELVENELKDFLCRCSSDAQAKAEEELHIW